MTEPSLPKLSSINDLSQATYARLHANAVSVNGKGLLIIGPAKSGKSTLTRALLSRSTMNVLIADDQVLLRKHQDRILMSAPEKIVGLIADREGHLTRHSFVRDIPLVKIIDLGSIAPTQILSEENCIEIFGHMFLTTSLSLETALSISDVL